MDFFAAAPQPAAASAFPELTPRELEILGLISPKIVKCTRH